MSDPKLHKDQGSPRQDDKPKTLTRLPQPEPDRLEVDLGAPEKAESKPQSGDGGRAAPDEPKVIIEEEHGEEDISPKLSRNGFTFISQLGQGGMGSVFLARDDDLGRVVAIKLLRKAMLTNTQATERFDREAKILASLSHKNIPVLYGRRRDPVDGDYLIIQEYLEGKDTDSIVREKGPYHWKDLERIAQEVCDALSAAHQAGIIHRDVKPANIFIAKNGKEQVKLLDFGIARIESASAQDGMTQQFGGVGSPEYMSPEQLENAKIDHRTDIYSLGVTMYELLTGEPPFQSDGGKSTKAAVYEIALKVIKEAPKPPSEVMPGIPAGFERLIMKCLAKDPADRFQGMDEMKAALSNAREMAAVEEEQGETVLEAEAPAETGELLDLNPEPEEPDQADMTSPEAFELGIEEGENGEERYPAPLSAGSSSEGVFRPIPISGIELDTGLRPTVQKRDTLVGTTLGGKYLIEERIGGGGMGSVYRAKLRFQDGGHAEAFEKTVAVKVMNPLSPDGDARVAEVRFIREAQAAANLNHPNIVGVQDFGRTADGRQFYVVEYLEGSDLHNVIYSGAPMTLPRFFSISSQICDGLHTAHTYKEPIVHRDIKPPNIFIDTRHGKDAVKIIDFGLAKIKNSGTAVTNVRDIIGTYEYMPPEQISGKLTDDPRVDIYAVGVTFYEMLCQKRPFDTRDFSELRRMITSEYPPEPISIRSDIPRELNDVVMKCLRKDPSERFGSMKELAKALQRIERKVVPRPPPSSISMANIPPQAPLQHLGAPQAAPEAAGEAHQFLPAAPAPSAEQTMSVEKMPLRKRLSKKAIAIGASIIAAAVIGGTVYSIGRSTGQEPARVTQSETERQDAAPAESASPTVPSPPVPVAPRSYTITFSAGIGGVIISTGEETVCTTADNGSCTAEIPAGSVPVTFTFRKEGYREAEHAAVPDSARTVEAQLEQEERSRPESVRTKRPPRPNPSGSGRGRGQRPIVITSPD